MVTSSNGLLLFFYLFLILTCMPYLWWEHKSPVAVLYLSQSASKRSVIKKTFRVSIMSLLCCSSLVGSSTQSNSIHLSLLIFKIQINPPIFITFNNNNYYLKRSDFFKKNPKYSYINSSIMLSYKITHS